jgi:hypothetical protein
MRKPDEATLRAVGRQARDALESVTDETVSASRSGVERARVVAADQLVKASQVIEPAARRRSRRLFWLAALIPVAAVVTWLARSLRPQAAADTAATDEGMAGATGAPATAAPGQAAGTGNGASSKVNESAG